MLASRMVVSVALIVILTVMWAVPVVLVDEGSQSQRTPVKITIQATTEPYYVDSPHPYSNNYDNTWTISKPDAVQIRVHFSQIQVEPSYDYVYVYDHANNQIDSYTGDHADVWSDWSYGDTIYVRLKTDVSVTDWGFAIDYIEYYTSTEETSTTTESSTLRGLTSGVAVGGYLEPSDVADYYFIDVGPECYSMSATLRCFGSDFDLYAKHGELPTRSNHDWSATSSGDDEHTVYYPASGRWFIMVYRFSGSGEYSLTVTLSYLTDTPTPGSGGLYSPLFLMDFNLRILALVGIVIVLFVLSKVIK